MFLNILCCFISNTWEKVWFLNKMFKDEDYQNLMNLITELNCAPMFETYWNIDKSILDIPRTNINAKRAVKIVEELHQKCKTDKYLRLKFISTNNF